MNVELADAPARRKALDLSINALVMAPAGSGKTGLLVQRMLRALAVVDQPEQVVAITFTRKAAAEIRQRIVEALAQARSGSDAASPHAQVTLDAARAVLERDREQGWNLEVQPARLAATTIDSFCAQLAAQSPVFSGLGGSMGVAEDAQPMYEQAIVRLFEEIEDESVPRSDRDALARILRLHANRLDRLLPPLSQLLAQRDRWLWVAADADADSWAEQERAVFGALWESARQAFERALGEEGQQTVLDCLSQGSTESELLYWAGELDGWPTDRPHLLRAIARSMLTGKDELRKTVNKNDGFLPKKTYTQRFKTWLKSHDGDDVLAGAAREIAWMPDPEPSVAGNELRAAWLRVLRRLAAHLRLVFAEAQQTDFAELAQAALTVLRPSSEEFGDALLRSDHRLQHLLVDEMQDTSEVQLMLVRQLTAGWQNGDGRSMFLVGDPQQSIYGFRNAEVRLFLGLWESPRIGDQELVPLRLSANFRSHPLVVDWFNQAFSRIFPRQVDIVRGAVPFSPSQALIPTEGEGGVSVHAFSESGAEAEYVAQAAAERVDTATTVAVLARTRSKLEPVIRAIRTLGLTPSCQDLDPLAALPEVRDVLALTLALWHPQDRLSWAVLLRAPFVGLSWQHMLALSVGRQAMPWPERIRLALDDPDRLDTEGRHRLQRLMGAIERTGSEARLAAHLPDRSEAVWRALAGPMCCSRPALDDVRQAFQCLRQEARGGTISDLAQLHRRLEKLYGAPRAGSIQLMTVHKAKGLEFDHVFIVGANGKPRTDDQPALHLTAFPQGTLLIPKPDDAWPEDEPAHRSYAFLNRTARTSTENEVMRLLYVAMTRARRSAQICLTAQRRDSDGQVQYQAGSFARALEPVIGTQVDQCLQDAAGHVEEPPADASPPKAARLPLSISLPEDGGLYRPAEVRSLRPSESVLMSQEDPDGKRDEGDLYAQLIGTLFHEAMQRIAEEGLQHWSDAGDSRRASMAAGLRRRGMPDPMVEPAVTRVVQLLRAALTGQTGRWLLSDKPWARCEYALAGMDDGRWVSAVIDRCFREPDGTLWVIDYKTSARPVTPEAKAEYLAAAEDTYREQIRGYTALMGRLHPGTPVKGALYFPDFDHLAVLPAATAADTTGRGAA